jgi:phytoene/squalene synthetase
MSPATSHAIQDLNEVLAEANAWMQAINEQEQPPVWAFPVARMVERIDAKAQAVEEILRREQVLA